MKVYKRISVVATAVVAVVGGGAGMASAAPVDQVPSIGNTLIAQNALNVLRQVQPKIVVENLGNMDHQRFRVKWQVPVELRNTDYDITMRLSDLWGSKFVAITHNMGPDGWAYLDDAPLLSGFEEVSFEARDLVGRLLASSKAVQVN